VKYAVEIDSGAIIYLPNFIKISSGIQKDLERGIVIQAHRQQVDL
jgi:hypothetical protein